MKTHLRRAVSLILSVVLCAALGAPALALELVPYSPKAGAAAFTDIPAGAPYAEAAYWCRGLGLMIGEENNQFKPAKQVDRGTAVTFLYRLAGEPAVTVTSAFTDVAAGAWYEKPVAWAVASGVTLGYGDGTFRPTRTVNREELAAFLWRAVGSPAAEAVTLTDAGKVSAWAKDAVAWAAGYELFALTGGGFAPQGAVVRSDAAEALMRYYQKAAVRDDVVDVACAATGAARMKDGSLLVVDSYERAIRLVKDGVSTLWAGGGTVKDVNGRPTAGNNDGDRLKSFFASPWAIVAYNGGFVVSDTDNGSLRFIREDKVVTLGLTLNKKALELGRPTGLAADGDTLYFSDTEAGKIYSMTVSGEVSLVAEGLDEPMGLCWNKGVLYVAETGADRVVTVDAAGKVTVLAGGSEGGYADGAAAQALFAFPQGVAVDGRGTVYVADTGNSAVRAVRDGVVTTLIMRDPASDERWPVEPVGLLMDGGVLYVCDSFARKVLAVGPGK